MGILSFVCVLPGVKALLRAIYTIKSPRLEREICGLKFPNPVGLAAGFDKNAKYIDQLACLGFGFIEIGTLTPVGQPGNPKPRSFRLTEDNALINRMGFNNDGLEVALERLKKVKSNVLIGGNIGKNKLTPNEQATEDYVKGFNALFDHVHYFVLNISSPNTPNLRELQDKAPLSHLLTTIVGLNKEKSKPKPVFLKIAPDVHFDQLDDIIEVVQEVGIDGIIATNTTIDRTHLITDKQRVEEIGAGGVSGKPVGERSTEIIEYISKKTAGLLPIIGVGGIHTAEDAIAKLKAGASLVQVYTGFVYEGPSLMKKINKAILKS